jgi:hypothetical protein
MTSMILRTVMIHSEPKILLNNIVENTADNKRNSKYNTSNRLILITPSRVRNFHSLRGKFFHCTIIECGSNSFSYLILTMLESPTTYGKYDFSGGLAGLL